MKLPILLVEDDEIDSRGIKRAVSDHALPVALTVASDGPAALDTLRNDSTYHSNAARKTGIILLDLNMPRMSGHEFLRELRKTAAAVQVPVVILSSSTNNRDVEESYALGAAGYFEKPRSAAGYGDILKNIVEYWSQSELPL